MPGISGHFCHADRNLFTLTIVGKSSRPWVQEDELGIHLTPECLSNSFLIELVQFVEWIFSVVLHWDLDDAFVEENVAICLDDLALMSKGGDCFQPGHWIQMDDRL